MKPQVNVSYEAKGAICVSVLKGGKPVSAGSDALDENGKLQRIMLTGVVSDAEIGEAVRRLIEVQQGDEE